jgi:predicted nuclease of predicted toxin-antitoxin system
VRFLIDNALSPLLAADLRRHGHDSVHLRDYGMQTASDEQVFARAASEHRVIVSADTDFALLLALRDVSEPSVILFRGTSARSPKKQVTLLLDNLGAIEGALDKGAVVVFDERRIRVRLLPIGRSD